MKDTEKAQKEISRIFEKHSMTVQYEITGSAMKMHMFAVNLKIYGNLFENILPKLQWGEKLIFFRNDGKWTRKTGPRYYDFEYIYNQEYDRSIYWENQEYGDCVRISSTMGTVDNFVEEVKRRRVAEKEGKKEPVVTIECANQDVAFIKTGKGFRISNDSGLDINITIPELAKLGSTFKLIYDVKK